LSVANRPDDCLFSRTEQRELADIEPPDLEVRIAMSGSKLRSSRLHPAA
jgi:chromosomal replication initiation ATPase DnaA